MAVLEGLTEDGADPDLLKPILERHREHFVQKCPICTPISHALRMYVETPDVPVYGARGTGFPRGLAEGLASPERDRRRKALEDLIARYIGRRFERVPMSAAQRREMGELLELGKRDGMAMLGPDFGTSCPSCAGATRVK